MTFRELFERMGGDLPDALKEKEESKAKAGSDEIASNETGEQELTASELLKITKLSKAVTALSVYAAGCDDSISIDEYMEIDIAISKLNNKYNLPDYLMKELKRMTEEHDVGWDKVCSYMDELSAEELKGIRDGLMDIFKASDGVSDVEQKVYDDFNKFISSKE
ncbi:MAG: hypothetical protein K6E10_05880 [Eubacterium sp.]|nr:hypothetical protein [Eubacterium sp.]